MTALPLSDAIILPQFSNFQITSNSHFPGGLNSLNSIVLKWLNAFFFAKVAHKLSRFNINSGSQQFMALLVFCQDYYYKMCKYV